MVMETDRLKTYDGNIRLVPNPKFDELMLAIQTQGPEAAGVLPITRRPGEDLYMIARGGNTRLQIIQMLWKQQDKRFRSVQCLFHPWPGEAKVLADHIAENENRGEMIFIEKALALQELKQKMEQDDGDVISLREFERRLNDASFGYGLRVSKSQLHRLQYASSFLYPLLPDALKAGLGPRHVEKLQKLDKLFSDYWQRRGEGGDETFRIVFGEVLKRHDGPDFTAEVIRQALEVRIADALGRSLHTVQAGLAALDAGIDMVDGEDEPDIESIMSGATLARPSPGRAAATPQAFHPASAKPSPTPTGTAHTPLMDIANMRSRAFDLAYTLAQRHGFCVCTINSGALGLGYWMELPAQPLPNAQTMAMWWMLAGLSEQLVRVQDEGIDHLRVMPPHSQLLQWIEGNHWDGIYGRVGRGSSWMVLPFFLHTSTSDSEDLAQLFQLLRQLRALAAQLNVDLWCTTTEK
jgi:ParB family protein of integrating conjugative element (PFGI_1 class)